MLESQEDWSNEALFELLKTFAQAQGLKVGTVMWPIRTALSGQETSPGGATELASLMRKEESLRRIRLGLNKLA
jgi:glutamyl-tRNA synthetase